MRASERQSLRRLYALIQVPFPHDSSGGKTATLEGFAAYQRDMRDLLEVWNETLRAVATGDPDVDVEVNLWAMEVWFAARVRENWDSRRVAGSPYDQRRTRRGY